MSDSASGPEHLIRAARAAGVDDPRVLEAFRRVLRERFVPPDRAFEAYVDRPVPIPHGQVTTQPSLVAQMVARLELTDEHRVLEVGTGLGFQTAILAALAREVWSVERFADLAAQAEHLLIQSLAHALARGDRCIRIVHGKGLRSGQRGPVLRNLVDELLRRVDAVLAFASAREVDGGAGASLVLLRSPRAAR